VFCGLQAPDFIKVFLPIVKCDDIKLQVALRRDFIVKQTKVLLVSVDHVNVLFTFFFKAWEGLLTERFHKLFVQIDSVPIFVVPETNAKYVKC
jgi:hypothetical protein